MNSNVMERKYKDYTRKFEFDTKIYNSNNIHTDKYFSVFSQENNNIFIYDNITLRLLYTLPFSNFKIDNMYWNQEQTYCIITSNKGHYSILKRICKDNVNIPAKEMKSDLMDFNKD